jgi:hypothetical protein
MAIQGGWPVVYVSLYRMHLIAVRGWLKGLALIPWGMSHHPTRLDFIETGSLDRLWHSRAGPARKSGFTEPRPDPVQGAPSRGC